MASDHPSHIFPEPNIVDWTGECRVCGIAPETPEAREPCQPPRWACRGLRRHFLGVLACRAITMTTEEDEALWQRKTAKWEQKRATRATS